MFALSFFFQSLKMFRRFWTIFFVCVQFKLNIFKTLNSLTCDDIDKEIFQCLESNTSKELFLNYPQDSNDLKVYIGLQTKKSTSLVNVVCKNSTVDASVIEKVINANSLVLNNIRFEWYQCPYPSTSLLNVANNLQNNTGHWEYLTLDSNVPTLKKKHLEGIITNNLWIYDLSSYDSDAFDGIEVLKTMMLHNFSLRDNIFRSQSSVTFVKLEGSEIEILSNDSFAGLSNVEELLITNNSRKFHQLHFGRHVQRKQRIKDNPR